MEILVHTPARALTISLLRLLLCSAIGSVPLQVRAAQGDVINLLEAMQEGSWLKINQNTFESQWVPPELRPLPFTSASSNPEGIIAAWSSFAWDSNRSQLWLYGGGHGNYAGNEVFTFNTSTFSWQRASLPSQVTLSIDQYGYRHGIPSAPDNGNYSPQAAHTYDNTVFLPRADRYVTFGGGAYNSGYGYVQIVGGNRVPAGPYFFDPSKADPNKIGGVTGSGVDPMTQGGNMWQNRNMNARSDLAAPFPTNFLDGSSAYAYQDGKEVIYKTGHQETLQVLYKYTVNDVNDPLKDTWEKVGAQNSNNLQSVGALDTKRNLYVLTGSDRRNDAQWGKLYFEFWNLNTAGPENPVHRVEVVTAPDDFYMKDSYGIDYDVARDVFTLWGGGGEVWTVKPPEPGANGSVSTDGWTVSKESFAGAVAPPELGVGSSGVLGKWQYASELNAFVALEGAKDGNVWIYKPEGWTDPLSPVPELPQWMMSLGGLALLILARSGKAARYHGRRAKIDGQFPTS